MPSNNIKNIKITLMSSSYSIVLTVNSRTINPIGKTEWYKIGVIKLLDMIVSLHSTMTINRISLQEKSTTFFFLHWLPHMVDFKFRFSTLKSNQSIKESFVEFILSLNISLCLFIDVNICFFWKLWFLLRIFNFFC